MAVSVQGFTTLVENQVATIQGACATLIDFTIGSILRAFVEAVASVALYLQAQALQVAALCFIATCYGADLDRKLADFGFSRLAANPSAGLLTFSRFTATTIGTLPVGTVGQSFDGSQQFTVLADTTNSAYSAASNSYTFPAGTTSITVAAQSLSTGTAANVSAGTINVIVGGVSGIDTVINNSAFADGANAESDAACKLRFVAYLASLSKATKSAVRYAISTVPGVSSYTLTENQNPAGATQYGYFYVVADDGTGMPGSGFLSTVYAAIDAVRPLGTYFNVLAPTTETANVALGITTGAGYVHSDVVAIVQPAITAFIAALGIGTPLPYSRLSQIAYDASPGVTNVSGVLLNGGTADLTATSAQRIIAGTIAVT